MNKTIISRTTTFLSFFFLLNCLLITTVSFADTETFLGKKFEKSLRESLVGEWEATVARTTITLIFGKDGSFVLGGEKGSYSLEGVNLSLEKKEQSITYRIEITNDLLTISGGDLPQNLVFSRKTEFSGFFNKLYHISYASLSIKLRRVIVIIAILLISNLIIMLFRFFFHFIVFSNWGPLRFFYRQRKNRVMTIYSIILNLLKYVIFFISLGFILNELGVNYKAYLASLSVIGIAIGFGSQGLVQDIVTGFFIIFEGQLDVGDMVEISGQTGTVEELGLRMTKLRNYMGQAIYIPNRFIAILGNYTRGALQTTIDIAVKDSEAAKKELPVLQQIIEEFVVQFKGVILGTPQIDGPLSLKTGEYFIRIQMDIWPQQQWIVDQQIAPRIRELLKKEGFEIPNDRIAVFYLARKK